MTPSGIADLGYAAGWGLVRGLPGPLAGHLFRRGADLAARRDGPGARRLRATLDAVVPGLPATELDRLVRAGLRSYARYWCEAFRLPAMDPVAVHHRMDPQVRGRVPFLDALDDGRGAIFALPHSGNWDVAGVWLVETLRARGREPAFTTVVERLRPASLYDRFVAYREALGFEVVAVDEGAAAHRALTRRLRGGGVAALVADRDLTGTGVAVTLFGRPARLPAGPARLAALTGAVLLPAYPRFTPHGWALEIGEPVPVADRGEVAKATQAVADAFTALIGAAPEDWHMLQPVFGPPGGSTTGGQAPGTGS